MTSVPSTRYPKHHSQDQPLSQENRKRKLTQMSLPKVFDPRRLRGRFASYWSKFIRTHYRNPEEVANTFGVRFQTACNWWNGTNRPSGDIVFLAGRKFHDFMEEQEQ